MAMDVRVVTPITTWGFRDKSEFRALERPDLTISHIEIETGPASSRGPRRGTIAGMTRPSMCPRSSRPSATAATRW